MSANSSIGFPSDTSFPHASSARWLILLVMTLGISMAFLKPNLAIAELGATSGKQLQETSNKSGSKAAPKKLLKYGDNKPDGKKSIAGSGEMIRFDLEADTAAIRAVRVHGSRYGYPQAPKEDFEVTLLSEDMQEVLHTELLPYSLFKRAKKGRWTHLPFEEPVDVPQTFWVVLDFNAEKTKGVYVSYDTSTKGKYSRVGTTDEDARETKFAGDWMVQVLLAK